MIQDDYGNLVSPTASATLTERLDAGDARFDRVEADLAANTAATRELVANTSELVSILNALKGAFRVLEFVGKLARPLGYIVGLGAAIAGVWTAARHGGGQQ